MISDVLSIVCLVGDDVEKGEDEAEEYGEGLHDGRRGCKGGQRGTALAPLVCIDPLIMIIPIFCHQFFSIFSIIARSTFSYILDIC